MKRIAFIIMVMCIPLITMSLGVITSPDKKQTQAQAQPQQESTNLQFFCPSINPTGGTINGHNYIDLGLSVKWATCNVGATSPSDYGSYFAWGETSMKTKYTTENSITYDKVMGDIAGNSQYDAARATWGGTWRLPTKAECEELIKKCTWKWTTQNGRNGYRVTSKANGNSIFLPAAGHCLETLLYYAGKDGNYWSSTPREYNTEYAYSLDFGSSNPYVYRNLRSSGRSVRPVSE